LINFESIITHIRIVKYVSNSERRAVNAEDTGPQAAMTGGNMSQSSKIRGNFTIGKEQIIFSDR